MLCIISRILFFLFFANAQNERMKISGKVYGLKMASGTDNMMLNMILQYKDSSKNFIFQPIGKDGTFENRACECFLNLVEIWNGTRKSLCPFELRRMNI